jgi:hypothetical protein
MMFYMHTRIDGSYSIASLQVINLLLPKGRVITSNNHHEGKSSSILLLYKITKY